MAKKQEEAGIRVNIYIPARQIKTMREISNFSNFVQICLDQAPDIMAFAILKDVDPKKYKNHKKLEDEIEAFNDRYPQNELTQKRTKKWPKHSANIQDIL